MTFLQEVFALVFVLWGLGATAIVLAACVVVPDEEIDGSRSPAVELCQPDPSVSGLPQTQTEAMDRWVRPSDYLRT